MKELDSIQLIAEFMGIYIAPFRKLTDEIHYVIADDEEGNFKWDEHLERYNPQTDYNQLMPVLERIGKEGCIIQISYCIITTCNITYLNKKHLPAVNFQNDNNGGKPAIEAIYKTVVEYLTWRTNEIKSTEPLPPLHPAIQHLSYNGEPTLKVINAINAMVTIAYNELEKQPPIN